ncbi:MAG: FtsX-like permease family protein [Oscillibacter sp.]|jgi:putative ABC transport system permease protein|nr:FtsX-like permease family protein [Oscillibacter sp.]
MIRIKNRGTVANLARRSLRSAGTRNRVAVAAIALTTLLFAALFTISGTLVDSFQQQTFRQVGGSAHGTFKNVTEEQLKTLRDDPLIVRSGARLLLGMPERAPFNKVHAELSYMDKNCAASYFCTPDHGVLPEEGTRQIACDTRILSLLGVEPKPGARVFLTYTIGDGAGAGKEVSDTFTLCGWWEYDPASSASMALVPLSYVKEQLSGYQSAGGSDTTGTWDLNIFLKSSRHIERDLDTILENHGFQNVRPGKDNYIAVGVNWAYVGAQLAGRADRGTIAAIAGLLALIMLTGYLIIYNIFQISVAGDIRFYGLLKTIGTTPRQLRAVIHRQALTLSAAGIPIGLALGWLTGRALVPAVLRTLDTYTGVSASVNPLIFLSAAAFSLLTVLISCARPGRMAGRVSPVEAVRWTEGGAKPAKTAAARRSRRASPARMALANLGRSRKRTVLVVLSLSLAVALLEITCIFTGGFDMDKYTGHFTASDFVLGSAGYFRHSGSFDADKAVPQSAIDAVEEQGGITKSGRIYGFTGSADTLVTKQQFQSTLPDWLSEDDREQMTRQAKQNNGCYSQSLQLYGMENAPLDRLRVVEGSLADLKDSGKNAIAAVYWTDDYDKPKTHTNWVKVGDQITVRYVDEVEYRSRETGKRIADPDQTDESCTVEVTKSHTATYTVAALVTVPNAMNYRYYGSPEFVLNAGVFQRDTHTSNIMTYLFDTKKSADAPMEQFLKNYTQTVNPLLDYESKATYAAQFNGFRSMFLLVGGALSGVITLVGVLNFFNAVLTSIFTRRREFAMLQAVGMTGRQLKTMLVWEGVLYALLSGGLSLALSLLLGPLLGKVMNGTFWFFTYRFTLIPVMAEIPVFLALGAALPLLAYRPIARQTIVERLRGVE